jgi:exopolyphosphatase/guanosine-5'-triphosphate,3'-diphosphate pyrophosphatase
VAVLTIPRSTLTLGIIDVGTNSIHLLIARRHPSRGVRIVARRRALVRLGEGGLVGNRLGAAAMQRALGVLRAYARLLRRHAVDHTEAVATSAVRDAANGRAFVRRVRRSTGLPLRILSGTEEARLIFRGVPQPPGPRRRVLMVAIGGGSAQVMCGTGERLEYGVSLPLGCARLAQRFIRHDPPQAKELAALQVALERAWAPVARALRRMHCPVVLGSSSMIEQVLRVAGSWHLRPAGSRPTGRAITQTQLRRLLGGLSPGRAGWRDQRSLMP